MTDRTINVFPHEPKWRVEFNGADHDQEFATKAEGIAAAIKWAEDHPPCEIMIYGPGWKLERSLVVPTGLYRRAVAWDRRRMQADIDFPDRRRQDRRHIG